jgi:ornithine cyclodeaminase/alanine dehydrogenase-like protein (mu-crystallin family)
VRGIEEIKVYSPTEINRKSFAEKMSEELNIEVNAMDSPDGVAKGSDIVATCTASQTPVFSREWIEPGMTIIDVRSTEIDNQTIKNVDRRFSTTNQNHKAEMIGGEKAEKYQSKRGKRGFVETDYPTLSEIICKNEIGRKNKNETIYYHNRSAGIQFVAVGTIMVIYSFIFILSSYLIFTNNFRQSRIIRFYKTTFPSLRLIFLSLFPTYHFCLVILICC